MRRPLLAAGLLTTALALPTASAVAHPSPASGRAPEAKVATVKPRSDHWEKRVVALTNARRKAHGRKPLQAAACADKFAEPWTRHLARRRVLEHQDLTPMLDCPHTSYAGENIAYGYETPKALVRAWMHSEGHRANILSRHFDRIGVSGWRATDGVTYATQDFLG
ncbi:MAG TPA: CAP domain-containing protein [Nocardioides sp.]|jgi:uncharacterized protein YkwD|nr:CAP domain-containing protein [Nocardioides sp.]